MQTNIFMFENLAFDSSLQDESGLESMVDGTFMENSSHDLRYDGRNYTYITGLLLAGQESGCKPISSCFKNITGAGVTVDMEAAYQEHSLATTGVIIIITI